MKRLLTLFLALCLLVSLTACGEPTRTRDFGDDAPAAAQTKPVSPEATTVSTAEPMQTVPAETASTITPALYKVTDESGNVLWLFGSIHVGQDFYYPLPKYVLSAYEDSDALAVECDVLAFASDLGAQTDALTQLIYLDGTKISDHIPEELYTRSVEVLEECGLYMSALDMYMPILWSNFIDTSLYETTGADSELGIDMYFLNNAHETGKEIREVESVEFQYGMLAGFSEELQIMMLEGSINSYENPEEAEQHLTQLMNAWSSGDADALSALLAEEGEFESEEEQTLYAEYNNAMIVERNLSMADYAEDSLASGDEVFICVGAAHVVGPGAMVDLLSQRGYTVERVSP